jgi:hypothetical protein
MGRFSADFAQVKFATIDVFAIIGFYPAEGGLS